MPEPRGRRHPLFLRLLKPVEPVYPDAFSRVAWDEEDMPDDAQGIVYIVTRHCAQMRRWAQQLRRLHAADETYKTEEGISPLSGAPLREANLRALGASLDLYSEDGYELRSGRSAVRAYLTTDLLVVVTERTGINAVGFVSFSLKWVVDAFDLKDEVWAAAGFKDTLLRCEMKLEVGHGNEKAIQPRVQA